MAREDGCQWMMHIDADEILIPSKYPWHASSVTSKQLRALPNGALPAVRAVQPGALAVAADIGICRALKLPPHLRSCRH